MQLCSKDDNNNKDNVCGRAWRPTRIESTMSYEGNVQDEKCLICEKNMSIYNDEEIIQSMNDKLSMMVNLFLDEQLKIMMF